MVLVEGTLQISADSAPAEADGEPNLNKSDSEPYMRHRLRDRLSFWKEIGACDMVLGWIEHGFMAFFGSPCEGWVKANQPCCFEPPEHPKFISESVAMLLRRGVIREWDPSWGKPKVVSPLKVVPKKGNKYTTGLSSPGRPTLADVICDTDPLRLVYDHQVGQP